MAKCPECQAEVEHVKDDFTGASFPVDVEPVRARGFDLRAARAGERSRRAVLVDVEVYRPHSATCTARLELGSPAEEG